MSTESTAVESAPRSPGRPRSTRADEAIMEAVLDLLAEGSTIESLSIEAIAAKAGVGKATIYRRWSGKQALLVDAIRRLKGQPSTPKGESVREDLLILARGVGRNPDPRASKIMPCLVPEVHRSPEQYAVYQEIVQPRRELTREVLRRGVQTGELRADLDVELATLLLTGPVLLQKIFKWNPDIDETDLPERVVDTVLAGLAPRP
ncbi:TetR/AcrR family transcriptional regulator [Phytohabitans flavus]|nr:TetR/AcrR family transcriptional regulator [Phytohabitans flavus]